MSTSHHSLKPRHAQHPVLKSVPRLGQGAGMLAVSQCVIIQENALHRLMTQFGFGRCQDMLTGLELMLALWLRL